MTPRRALAVVAVAVLVTTAGCSVFSTGSSSPPGVTDGNVTDASALVEAHTSELRGTSFTFEATRTIEYEDRNYSVVSEYTYHVDAGDPFRGWVEIQRSVRGDPPDRVASIPDMEMWRSGDSTYVRVETENGSRYQALDLVNSSLTMNDVSVRQKVARLAEATNATVGPVTRDGESLTRVAATIEPSGAVQQSDLTVLVTDSGLVREYEATQVVQFAGARRTVTSEGRFVELGDTTVERPDWVSEAENRTDE